MFCLYYKHHLPDKVTSWQLVQKW